ncbi:MAG TPA: diacylglycerol kinase family protein [Cytophagaceae bacterium]|jgi:diacylglycerol kinase|nr:diacylglycerol kinase family protein [Cytophagaceae bacterium]
MIIKTLQSFRYAIRGIWLVFRNENNAKIHLLATLVVLCAGFYFNLTRKEWLGLFLAIALVWICEAFNTAIEKLVNLAHPGYSRQAGEIKDIAAGAVLIAAIFSIITALIIFIPKLNSF